MAVAIPHYLVVAIFVGGGLWLGTRAGTADTGWDDGWGAGVSLVSLLLCIAAITLLFTGRYPGGIYDFVLGMNRWTLRVVAYAALMTDTYPPFRLDQGGTDPASPTPLPPPTGAQADLDQPGTAPVSTPTDGG